MVSYLIGVDEVGRGALAGPVVVAAVAVPETMRLEKVCAFPLRDSKRLVWRQREAWEKAVRREKKIRWQIARVTPAVIDRINIRRAANLAAGRAVRRLVALMPEGARVVRVLLDGGLEPTGFKDKEIKVETVVRADQMFPVVMLASIMAKERRDRQMRKLAGRWPDYGFDIHVGYGTERHREWIKAKGLLSIHRKSFIGKLT